MSVTSKRQPTLTRLEQRQPRAAPIAAKLHEWLLLHRLKVLDRSASARATVYSPNRWLAPTYNLNNPALPIDNGVFRSNVNFRVFHAMMTTIAAKASEGVPETHHFVTKLPLQMGASIPLLRHPPLLNVCFRLALNLPCCTVQHDYLIFMLIFI